MPRNLSQSLYNVLALRESGENISINGYDIFTSNTDDNKFIVHPAEITIRQVLSTTRYVSEEWSCRLDLFTRADVVNDGWVPALENLHKILEYLDGYPTLSGDAVNFLVTRVGTPLPVKGAGGLWIMYNLTCKATMRNSPNQLIRE